MPKKAEVAGMEVDADAAKAQEKKEKKDKKRKLEAASAEDEEESAASAASKDKKKSTKKEKPAKKAEDSDGDDEDVATEKVKKSKTSHKKKADPEDEDDEEKTLDLSQKMTFDDDVGRKKEKKAANPGILFFSGMTKQSGVWLCSSSHHTSFVSCAADEKDEAGNPPIKHFDVSPDIVANLAKRNITHMFPIQAATFDVIRSGKDLIGRVR